jgi:hypothetical protein
VAARTDGSLRGIPEYPGGEACHAEAKFPQHVAEKQVVLEAIASTSCVYELALEGP